MDTQLLLNTYVAFDRLLRALAGVGICVRSMPSPSPITLPHNTDGWSGAKSITIISNEFLFESRFLPIVFGETEASRKECPNWLGKTSASAGLTLSFRIRIILLISSCVSWPLLEARISCPLVEIALFNRSFCVATRVRETADPELALLHLRSAKWWPRL